MIGWFGVRLSPPACVKQANRFRSKSLESAPNLFRLFSTSQSRKQERRKPSQKWIRTKRTHQQQINLRPISIKWKRAHETIISVEELCGDNMISWWLVVFFIFGFVWLTGWCFDEMCLDFGRCCRFGYMVMIEAAESRQCGIYCWALGLIWIYK